MKHIKNTNYRDRLILWKVNWKKNQIENISETQISKSR